MKRSKNRQGLKVNSRRTASRLDTSQQRANTAQQTFSKPTNSIPTYEDLIRGLVHDDIELDKALNNYCTIVREIKMGLVDLVRANMIKNYLDKSIAQLGAIRDFIDNIPQRYYTEQVDTLKWKMELKLGMVDEDFPELLTVVRALIPQLSHGSLTPQQTQGKPQAGIATPEIPIMEQLEYASVGSPDEEEDMAASPQKNETALPTAIRNALETLVSKSHGENTKDNTTAKIIRDYLRNRRTPLVPDKVWKLNRRQQRKSMIQPLMSEQDFQRLKEMMEFLCQLMKTSTPVSFKNVLDILTPNLTHKESTERARNTVRNMITNTRTCFC